MTSLVFDFKDIAARMKKEDSPNLGSDPRPPIAAFVCLVCNGTGQDPRHSDSPCPHCVTI